MARWQSLCHLTQNDAECEGELQDSFLCSILSRAAATAFAASTAIFHQQAASKTCETRQARKTLTYRQTVERGAGVGSSGSIPGIAYNKRRQNVVAVTPHKLRRRRRHFKSVYLLLLKLKLLASWKVSFGTQTYPISSFPVSGTLPDSAGQLGSLSLVMPSTFHFI